MAQADSVHSTPPTNMSPTRRKILGTIAAAAAATTIAVKPAVAIGPIAPDPIYAAIERHTEAAVIWDAAVTHVAGGLRSRHWHIHSASWFV
jgi:hypothetical protein